MSFSELNFYRPSTKLREANVFTGVCLSFSLGGHLVTITRDALDLIVQDTPTGHQNSYSQPWSPWTSDLVITGDIQTCSFEDPLRTTSSDCYWSTHGFQVGNHAFVWKGNIVSHSCPCALRENGWDLLLRTISQHAFCTNHRQYWKIKRPCSTSMCGCMCLCLRYSICSRFQCFEEPDMTMFHV